MDKKAYAITNMWAVHMGSEGVNEYNEIDDKEYWEFKQKEVKDPRKQSLIKHEFSTNLQMYNSFCSCCKNRKTYLDFKT